MQSVAPPAVLPLIHPMPEQSGSLALQSPGTCVGWEAYCPHMPPSQGGPLIWQLSVTPATICSLLIACYLCLPRRFRVAASCVVDLANEHNIRLLRTYSACRVPRACAFIRSHAALTPPVGGEAVRGSRAQVTAKSGARSLFRSRCLCLSSAHCPHAAATNMVHLLPQTSAHGAVAACGLVRRLSAIDGSTCSRLG
jgi:hypothetical protein